jgi:hypothetical protein
MACLFRQLFSGFSTVILRQLRVKDTDFGKNLLKDRQLRRKTSPLLAVFGWFRKASRL